MSEESGEAATESPKDDYVLASEAAETPKPEEKPESQEADKEQQDTAEGKKLSGWQRTKQRYERELSQERERAQKLTEELDKFKSTAPKETAKPDGEPKEDDFDTYGDYVVGKARWEAKQEVKAAFEQQQKASQEEKVKQEYQEHVQTYRTKADEYSKEVIDFDKRINDYQESGFVTPIVEMAIMNSDLGPQIAYHIATNPELAVELAHMDPWSVNRTIAKIEARLENQESPKAAVKTTKAPPPVTPVGSSRGNVEVDLDKADMETFTRIRNEQIRARGGR